MTEFAYNSPEFSPEILYGELAARLYAELTDVLLTKGAVEADGSYYTAALDDDTYAMVTNYATASCHTKYRINPNDRSQRTSLETGDPIISVEFRHNQTDDVKQGYIIFQPQSIRQDSLIGMALKATGQLQSDAEILILNTSDLTEVSGREMRNSLLYELMQNIN